METIIDMSNAEPERKGIFSRRPKRTPPPTPPRKPSPKPFDYKKLKNISSELKSSTKRSPRDRVLRAADIPTKHRTGAISPISSASSYKDVGDLGSPWQKANVSVIFHEKNQLYLVRKEIATN